MLVVQNTPTQQTGTPKVLIPYLSWVVRIVTYKYCWVFAFDFGIHRDEIRLQESGSSVGTVYFRRHPRLHSKVRVLGAVLNSSATLRLTAPDPWR